jgi:hypothetical protein
VYEGVDEQPHPPSGSMPAGHARQKEILHTGV